MAKQTTGKRGLQKATQPGTIPAATTDGVAARPGDLAKRLRADRVRRRMTWPVYANFLGVKLSTVYKIARERTERPHELTVAQIEERMRLPVDYRKATTAEGAADAVVSSGQRHPKRPED